MNELLDRFDRMLLTTDGTVTTLLEGSWAPPDESSEEKPVVRPAASLHDVARSLERALYERLFRTTDGDFEAMARSLLRGDAKANARRVRLRFNQLGLRAKDRR